MKGASSWASKPQGLCKPTKRLSHPLPPSLYSVFCLLLMGFYFILTLWKRMYLPTNARANHFIPNLDANTKNRDFVAQWVTVNSLSKQAKAEHRWSLSIQVLTARVTKEFQHGLWSFLLKKISPSNTLLLAIFKWIIQLADYCFRTTR